MRTHARLYRIARGICGGGSPAPHLTVPRTRSLAASSCVETPVSKVLPSLVTSSAPEKENHRTAPIQASTRTHTRGCPPSPASLVLAEQTCCAPLALQHLTLPHPLSPLRALTRRLPSLALLGLLLPRLFDRARPSAICNERCCGGEAAGGKATSCVFSEQALLQHLPSLSPAR